ncbi:hypothetical protein Tco_0624277 [Tanacetum coccineum]|uniref:Uncharacterized protein n=1 Tax=Tanacetum coccineum TaxID=301880 RepID=A0ABQ4WDH6_9ASTR
MKTSKEKKAYKSYVPPLQGNPEKESRTMAIIDSGCSGKYDRRLRTRKGNSTGHLARRFEERDCQRTLELLQLDLFGLFQWRVYIGEKESTAWWVTDDCQQIQLGVFLGLKG